MIDKQTYTTTILLKVPEDGKWLGECVGDQKSFMMIIQIGAVVEAAEDSKQPQVPIKLV